MQQVKDCHWCQKWLLALTVTQPLTIVSVFAVYKVAESKPIKLHVILHLSMTRKFTYLTFEARFEARSLEGIEDRRQNYCLFWSLIFCSFFDSCWIINFIDFNFQTSSVIGYRTRSSKPNSSVRCWRRLRIQTDRNYLRWDKHS